MMGLKVRAFKHTGTPEMFHDVAFIDFNNQKIGFNYQIGDGTRIDVEELANVTLIQYTGLKDKNGREIYEGDILRVWVTKTINFVAMVDCLNGAFGIGSIPSGYGYHHKFSSFHNNVGTRYEVIGNIYENKNLLEEK